MKKLQLVLILILVFIGCEKEESEREFPAVTTSSEVVVSADGVLVSGTFDGSWSSKIIDHGFVYYPVNSDVTNYIKVSLGNTISEGNYFRVKLERSLYPGQEYVFKAYVSIESYTVYGDEQLFLSKGGKAPELKSFIPGEAWIGDTITISGEYFSDKNEENNIQFGSEITNPFYSNDTILKVIVPKSLSQAESIIKIEVAEKSSSFSNAFKLKNPVIEQLIPNRIYPGEKLTIKGNGLLSLKYLIIDQSKIPVETNIDSIAVFALPKNLSKGNKSLQFMMLDKQIDLEISIEIKYPVVTSVTPDVAWIDSVLTIKGEGFDKLENFQIGRINLQEISKNDTIAKVRVIEAFTTASIQAIFYSQRLEFEPQVKFDLPVINSITPSVTYAGEQITLKGERFIYGMSPSIGTFQSINENTAVLALPNTLSDGTYTIDLDYWYDRSVGTVTFTVPKIAILDYYPKEITRGDTVSIVVENIPQSLNGWHTVAFDKKSGDWIDMVGNTIKVVVPQNTEVSSSPTLSVYYGGQVAEIPNAFTYNDYWSTVDKNYAMSGGACTFVENAGDHYVLFQDQFSSSLKRFNATTENWVQISSTDLLNYCTILTSFSVDNDLYFITRNESGNSSNLKYSLSNNTWSYITGYPSSVENLSKMYSFVINNIAYVGFINALYQYNVSENKWEKKTTLPTTHYELKNSLYFNTSDEGFIGFTKSIINRVEYNEFWKYLPSSDTWSDLGAAPLHVYYGGATIVLDNKVYIVGRGYNLTGEFVVYDVESNQVEQLTTPPGYWNDDNYLFNVNGTVYFMSRPNSSEGWKIYKIPESDLPKLVR